MAAGDITPRDGNCFYHALLQQIHWFETLESLIPLTPIPNYLQLCRMICRYIEDNQNETSYIWTIYKCITIWTQSFLRWLCHPANVLWCVCYRAVYQCCWCFIGVQYLYNIWTLYESTSSPTAWSHHPGVNLIIQIAVTYL